MVTLSLVSLGPLSLPTNVMRVMRAFRIVCLFGRLRSLREIIQALSMSMIPVMNSFIILLLATCVYAIFGVTLFADVSPDDFGVFDKSFLTMFKVVAGDTWMGNVPSTNEDGSVNADAGPIVMAVIQKK